MLVAVKRVRLAEYFGWKFHPPLTLTRPSDEYKSQATHCWVRPGSSLHQLEELPDYFGSLQVMFDAEEWLLTNRDYLYWCNPKAEAPTANLETRGYLNHLIAIAGNLRDHATSDQRAEAMGRTLKLW